MCRALEDLARTSLQVAVIPVVDHMLLATAEREEGGGEA